MLSIRRWRATHLLGAWVVYWLLLALVALGRPLLLARRIAALPEGRSSASASFGDGAVDARLVADGATLWHGHAAYGTVLLWLLLPPLLLWLLWAVRRPPPTEAADAPHELGAGDPIAGRAADRVVEKERRR